MKKIANLTEQQVLEQLGIPDFRHLTKDKVMAFFSMIPNMNSEIVKKAIEQFPYYVGAVREVVGDYMEILSAALAEDAKANQAYYSNCKVILEALSKLLEKDDLSFEERRYIIDTFLEVEERMSKKITESKEYHLKLAAAGFVIVSIVIISSVAVLGVNSRISVPKVKS